MRFFRALTSIFIAVILFSSCQKEYTPDIIPGTTNSNTSLVKTYTEEITSGSMVVYSNTYDISYDANNRIVSMISRSNAGDKFIYKYNSNNTYTMDLYNSNVVSIHQLVFINNNSLIDSTMQQNNTMDSSSEKYIYNSTKQLIQIKQYSGTLNGYELDDIINYEYDNNGNITSETSQIQQIKFEYYTDLFNDVNTGMIYHTASKNLIKKATYTSDSSTQVVNHTYTFDSSKRLTSDKIVSDGGENATKKYTY